MTEITALPQPRYEGWISLEEALLIRRSIRVFKLEALNPEEISQLLWATQGCTDDRGFRTVPSAGALFPLEVYILTHEGISHYLPQGHALAVHRQGDFRRDLYLAALNQEAIFEAPLTIVITAVYARVEQKYGPFRTPRYVHLEAGHGAQNALLQAVSLGLGAVPIAAFEDKQVIKVLDLPDDQQPLYLIPVGHPG